MSRIIEMPLDVLMRWYGLIEKHRGGGESKWDFSEREFGLRLENWEMVVIDEQKYALFLLRYS